MNDRFETLYRLDKNLYKKGTPIIVSDGALLKDNDTGTVVLQLKFLSIANKEISGLKVSINAFDVSKQVLKGIKEYQYLDLFAINGDYFGSNKAIMMPNNVTRSIEIDKIIVVYSDGETEEVNVKELVSIEEPTEIYTLLKDDELVKQYSIETKSEANYIPKQIEDDLWQCTCGKLNNKEICSDCNANKEKVFSALNEEQLEKNLKVRIEEETKAREEKINEIIEMAKKVLPIAIIVIAIFFIGNLLFGTNKVEKDITFVQEILNCVDKEGVLDKFPDAEEEYADNDLSIEGEFLGVKGHYNVEISYYGDKISNVEFEFEDNTEIDIETIVDNLNELFGDYNYDEKETYNWYEWDNKDYNIEVIVFDDKDIKFEKLEY